MQAKMQKDERDLVEVLKAELDFLEKGGYGRSPRQAWKQPLIFVDSPSCMNYDNKDCPTPCSECVLMQLVPPQFRRSTDLPCGHIPLNDEGETLDSLYRYADQSEIEETFGNWLRKTIASLELQRELAKEEAIKRSPSIPIGTAGQPLRRQQAKCANPDCATPFRWMAGGKFFRFQPESDAPQPAGKAPSALQIDGAQHFWLCEHCSHIFTLGFDAEQGVVLRLLWPELLAGDIPKQLPSHS